MVLEINSILEHNPYENNLIRVIQNYEPLNGENGHWWWKGWTKVDHLEGVLVVSDNPNGSTNDHTMKKQ